MAINWFNGGGPPARSSTQSRFHAIVEAMEAEFEAAWAVALDRRAAARADRPRPGQAVRGAALHACRRARRCARPQTQLARCLCCAERPRQLSQGRRELIQASREKKPLGRDPSDREVPGGASAATRLERHPRPLGIAHCFRTLEGSNARTRKSKDRRALDLHVGASQHGTETICAKTAHAPRQSQNRADFWSGVWKLHERGDPPGGS